MRSQRQTVARQKRSLKEKAGGFRGKSGDESSKTLMKGEIMRKFFALSIIILVFVACSKEEVINDFVFDEFKPNEKITLRSINGESLTLVRTEKGFLIDGDEDKVLMLDFFGTFCAPCKQEAAHLTQLWRKNAQNFVLVGLTHFEEVSDEVVREFANTFGAYYFLSNSKQNARIIAQVLQDINYQRMEQLPFKVALKDGVYQQLSNNFDKEKKGYFYLGAVPSELMQKDLNAILGKEYAKN